MTKQEGEAEASPILVVESAPAMRVGDLVTTRVTAPRNLWQRMMPTWLGGREEAEVDLALVVVAVSESGT